MLLMTAASRAAWMPRTALTLRDYLAGEWRLSKGMRYQQGGVSGQFVGTASFSALQSDVLTYLESGQVDLGSPPMTATATQRYLWDFSDGNVRVLFDECTGHRSPEAIMRSARFFHAVDVTTIDEEDRIVRFEHPCPCVAGDGIDLYVGNMCFASPDSFSIRWQVTGPRKEGAIANEYTRAPTSEG